MRYSTIPLRLPGDWRTSRSVAPGLREEVADAIVFLASDEAAYITGADVTIDGGQTAG
ncbi:SDR family oxidoreductase [Sphingomonas sp. NFX23]|uniref:SDR family oxidoreductase n=1 Tax=Sphingomonas sp. NFX23 TaxID=2819532 RepID=UPI003CF4AEAD